VRIIRRARVAVEDRDVIAERASRARQSETRARTYERHAFAVLVFGALGRCARMSDLLSAATRFQRQIATGSGSRIVVFDPAARHAGSHGRSQVGENSREHVRLPVDEIGSL